MRSTHHPISDEQIGEYHDRYIAPDLLVSGVPAEVVASMRARYIRDVRANPEALRQLATTKE